MAKPTKKQLEVFHRRCAWVTQSEVIYRTVLRAVVGWDEFQNIDARATDDKISLHQAAKDWAEGALHE